MQYLASDVAALLKERQLWIKDAMQVGADVPVKALFQMLQMQVRPLVVLARE